MDSKHRTKELEHMDFQSWKQKGLTDWPFLESEIWHHPLEWVIRIPCFLFFCTKNRNQNMQRIFWSIQVNKYQYMCFNLWFWHHTSATKDRSFWHLTRVLTPSTNHVQWSLTLRDLLTGEFEIFLFRWKALKRRVLSPPVAPAALPLLQHVLPLMPEQLWLPVLLAPHSLDKWL